MQIWSFNIMVTTFTSTSYNNNWSESGKASSLYQKKIKNGKQVREQGLLKWLAYEIY